MKNNTGGSSVKDTICSILDSACVPYDYFEHKEASSAKDSAVVRKNYTLSEGSKALILRVGRKEKKHYVQVVISGDVKFSNAKVRTLLNEKNIALASPEAVQAITNGVLPGGIPPFGNIFELVVYVDKKVINKEKMVFSCGLRTASIGMKTVDYVQLVKPIIVDISID